MATTRVRQQMIMARPAMFPPFSSLTFLFCRLLAVMLCDKGLPCSVFSPLSSTAKFCFGKYAINRNQHCQELSFCGSKCLLQRSPAQSQYYGQPLVNHGQHWSNMVNHVHFNGLSFTDQSS